MCLRRFLRGFKRAWIVAILSECKEMEEMVEGYSKELDRRIIIEKGLVKPLLKGDDVHRYEMLKSDKVVIFPYFKKIEDGKEKGRALQ